MPILNSSLASGLGRPDLIGRNVQSRAAVGNAPVAAARSGSPMAMVDGGRVPGGAPTVALMVLIAALGGFIYWVHPHLA